MALTLMGAGYAASPAWAGGVGDFLSPAFGTSCTNHHGARSEGSTTHDTGVGNGNLAGLPIGSPFNQCGGADLLPVNDLSQCRTAALPVDVVDNIVGMVPVCHS
ncbi:DUF320 domain-containing protein [Streptomyces sp. SCA2-4]|nr:DUF320 domain-containing protein [Streptomyces huiliensis]